MLTLLKIPQFAFLLSYARITVERDRDSLSRG
jgi:hypothetical protein